MNKEYRMSEARFQELQEELNYLKTTRSDEVAEMIKVARGFGDLSENSEYDEAKSEQGKLYSKIAELHNLLENAEIVEADVVEQGVVGLGSVVTVLDVEFNEEETFQIVGSQEANPMDGKLSEESPIGRGLLGHKEGETVVVKAPAGEMQFKILAVKHD